MKEISVEEFLAENCWGFHLKGFKYLVRICELYSHGKNIKESYKIIAKEFNTTWTSVEKDIRYYKNKIKLYNIEGVRDNPQNNELIAAIIYTVNRLNKRRHT